MFLSWSDYRKSQHKIPLLVLILVLVTIPLSIFAVLNKTRLFPQATSQLTTVTINAQGLVKNTSEWPKMAIYVNYASGNSPFITYITSWNAKDYKIVTTLPISKLDIVFPNQKYNAEKNSTSALMINSVNVNGIEIFPKSNGANCIYDRGSGLSAFDGVNADKTKCQKEMWWDGSLHFTNIPSQPLPSPVSNSGYIVKPILFVPSDQIVDETWLPKIDSYLKFVQGWYAFALDGKTFSYDKPIIYKSKKPLSWFHECRIKNRCTEITYYNVFEDLKNAGYPTGSAFTTKVNLIVFFQGEVFDKFYGLGGIDYDDSQYNMTYMVLTPYLDPIKNLDPFQVDLDTMCPSSSANCTAIHRLGIIAHEMVHTFGLNHIPNGSPREDFPSIVAGAFPFNSFSATETNDEMSFMLSNPFMNMDLKEIPYPLSRLRKFSTDLKVGDNTFTVPINSAGGRSLRNMPFFDYILPYCDTLTISKNNIVKTVSCASYYDQDVPLNTTVSVKMNRGMQLNLFGLSP